jgi:hypothetical protein
MECSVECGNMLHAWLFFLDCSTVKMEERQWKILIFPYCCHCMLMSSYVDVCVCVCVCYMDTYEARAVCLSLLKN